VVASASYEARVFGVRSAVPSLRARRLCPHLIVVPPDHRAYEAASEEVFAIFRRFTPLVEGLSLDEAFLDVSGLRLHATSPVAVGEDLQRTIRTELGLPASVGIASTKFVAKLASEAAKPDGLRHVPAGRVREFLDPLPVSALWGVGEATLAALARLGIETVADLAAQPRPALARALGDSLADHLSRLAVGDDPRPVRSDHEVKSVSAEETYPEDLSTLAEVEAALRGHADRVGARLRRAGLAARTVTLKVRFSDFTTITRSETTAGPTDVDIEIFDAARRLLRRADLAGRGVRLVGIAASGLSEAGAPRQLIVGEDERWHRLDSAVDEIRSRFGHDSVVPARLNPGRPPSGR
jgi:DNA polymerase-4